MKGCLTPRGLGRTLSEVLNFNSSVVEEASVVAGELGKALSVDKETMAKAKETRDRASTLFERMYDEVRLAGRYIFRNDPNRLSEYRDRTE